MKSGIHPSPGYTASLTFQAVSQREESTAPTGDGPEASVRGTHPGEPDPFCPHSPREHSAATGGLERRSQRA